MRATTKQATRKGIHFLGAVRCRPPHRRAGPAIERTRLRLSVASRDGTTEIWFASVSLSSDSSLVLLLLLRLKGEVKFHVEDAEKAPVLMDLVHDHLCYRVLILLGFLAFFAQGLHYILFTLYILAQSCIKLKSFSLFVTQRHNYCPHFFCRLK